MQQEVRGEANEFVCPHCGACFAADCEDQYVDDVEDGSSTTCSICNKEFRLRCVEVQLFFVSVP